MPRGKPPKKPFNWDIVDALMTLKSSERYIAVYLLKNEGIEPNKITEKAVVAKIKLIQRRIKERWDCSFVQYREQKQDDWKVELTQMQRAAAKSGKVAMMIWLGKQDLGQTDKIEQKNENTELVHIYVPKNGSEADAQTN